MIDNHVEEQFLQWHEGTLPIEVRAEVEAHLKRCPRCAAYFQAMESALIPVEQSDLPRLEADPFLPTRVRARVNERKQMQSAPQKRRSWLTASEWALSSTLVMLALTCGIYLGSNFVSTQNQFSNQSYTEEEIISDFYKIIYLEEADQNLTEIFGTVSDESEL